MNKKKRIIELETRVEGLEKANAVLETRVQVLDFKEEAKGATYIVKEKSIYIGFPHFIHGYEVSFLSAAGDKVIKERFGENDSITQNGKYLEFRNSGKITSAMRVYNDKLVDMDVDVYTKAFPERVQTQEKPKVDINAEVSMARDRFATVADAWERIARGIY